MILIFTALTSLHKRIAAHQTALLAAAIQPITITSTMIKKIVAIVVSQIVMEVMRLK